MIINIGIGDEDDGGDDYEDNNQEDDNENCEVVGGGDDDGGDAADDDYIKPDIGWLAGQRHLAATRARQVPTRPLIVLSPFSSFCWWR